MTGSKVYITDHFHGKNIRSEVDVMPIKRDLYYKGKVVIEENVWIGDGCVIMPNVHIGKGAIIGANAVVTKDIPENAIAAGVPAKVLKIL